MTYSIFLIYLYSMIKKSFKNNKKRHIYAQGIDNLLFLRMRMQFVS